MGPNYYVKPAPSTSGLSKKIIYLIGGIVLAILVGVGLLLLSSTKDTSASSIERLIVRLDDLSAYTSDKAITRDLKSDELLNTTTELNLSVVTKINSISSLLPSQPSTSKTPQNFLADEETLTSTKLESAKVNNKLDSEFRNILIAKIGDTNTLIVKLYGSLRDPKIKSEVKKTNELLETYQQKLEKITL